MVVLGIGDCSVVIRGGYSLNNLAGCCLAKHANSDIGNTGAGGFFSNQNGTESRSGENEKMCVISVRYIKCDIEPPQNLLRRSTADLT
jgi:hypothetical protein